MLTKVCIVCGVEKGVAEYHNQKECKYGVKSDCKVCRNQHRMLRYKANREAEIEQQKSYQRANKDAVVNRKKAYYKANPHLFNANNAKRRAQKIQSTPSWINKEHIESLYMIASINRQGGYDMHVDHIVPLQSDTVCGLHCEANLQLLPASDNKSKGNRHWPDMW